MLISPNLDMNHMSLRGENLKVRNCGLDAAGLFFLPGDELTACGLDIGTLSVSLRYLHPGVL